MDNFLELSGIVDSYNYLFEWFCCLQNGNRFLLFCFLQNWSLILLFFVIQKSRDVSVKKFLMFEVANVFWGSDVPRRKPEIECSRMSCSDVFESYSMCYLFTDSSTTSILSLAKKWLPTPDKVSVNTSPMNNSGVIRKLFRKRLIFSSNSCVNLLLDKRVLGAMPTTR